MGDVLERRESHPDRTSSSMGGSAAFGNLLHHSLSDVGRRPLRARWHDDGARGTAAGYETADGRPPPKRGEQIRFRLSRMDSQDGWSDDSSSEGDDEGEVAASFEGPRHDDVVLGSSAVDFANERQPLLRRSADATAQQRSRPKSKDSDGGDATVASSVPLSSSAARQRVSFTDVAASDVYRPESEGTIHGIAVPLDRRVGRAY